ncbi:hypothetical protein ABQ284_11475 [Lentilactobacillus buchneri]|uniref:hypothetical protein n=1 Tax=Lentilactobacillus buchneri TaxID=1581 RepID=UPI0030F3209F
MTNTAGFRRMKARKQKLEDHYDISIDACGNAVKVKKAIKQARQKTIEKIAEEFSGSTIE